MHQAGGACPRYIDLAMKYKDYYAALGVAPDASLEQIKKAYRKLARAHHPDVSSAPGAEAKFKDAAEAYATLKDPDKRAAYDELGPRPPGEEFSPPPRWSHDFADDAASFDDVDLADLLASLGRHGAARAGAMASRGRDFEVSAAITLEQAHQGATLKLQLQDGEQTRTLEVSVPAGVVDGQKLRLRGQGGKGRNGGPDGDIYLQLVFAPHPVFRTDRHDLYFDLALSPWEAVLGAEVQVPTLEGPVVLTVPAGTRSGRRLRLRGRGLAIAGGGRGDLYASVLIDVPVAPTARERELFQALAAESSFDPRAANKEKQHAPVN
jgi:curved DNA-binding protein